jgi:putative PIN family toxin of toxin-antitoxin system
MRVVLDTNVLVSAALKQNSIPAEAVHTAERSGILLKSAATERQLNDVIARSYFLPLIGPETRAWLRRVIAAAELVAITEQIAACRDPTDDKFLELAINGRADLVVSGDMDLLALDPFRGIPIITPAAFVENRRQFPG